MLRCIGLVTILAVSTLSVACMNDTDTLGFELRNKPDVQRALTGRFDRFPPLYYDMRIKRLRAKESLTASECDDLAVALARLGRNEEGLVVLERKAKLKGLSHDDMYHLYANRGTLLAHQWIHDGAKLKEIGVMQRAERDIALAIKLNPTAHFGREGVQLETIRWLMATKKGSANGAPLGEWLSVRISDAKIDQSLAGLIMLGGAWESPDVALAIAEYTGRPSHDGIANLALARYKELIRKGKKSFSPEAANEAIDTVEALTKKMPGKVAEPIEVRYERLRREADDWLGKRMSYVSERLARGEHPDTDPNFWRDLPDSPAPKVPTKLPKPGLEGFREQVPWQVTWGLAGGLVVGLFSFLVIRAGNRSR